MYRIINLVLWLSLLGYGLGIPYSSMQTENAHVRSKRELAGYPSLSDFEIRKAALYSVSEVLQLEFCNGDHLAGVTCPGEAAGSSNATCASWEEVCNGNQYCGAAEYDACVEQTIEVYGVAWLDYCRGDEKVDFCRFKDFQPIRCGSDIELLPDRSPERITSPNYDDSYHNDVFCFWRVSAPAGSSIKVNIKTFGTETNYDYLSIGKGHDYLGAERSQYIIYKHSGDALPDPAKFQTPNNEIFVAFVADAYQRAKGFELFVSVADADEDAAVLDPKESDIDTDCGGLFAVLSVVDVEIVSPNFPENYGPNMRCDWRIDAPAGRSIAISVIRMDTEYRMDTLSVGSGDDVGNADNVVARLGGNDIPTKPVVVQSDKAWVRFESDSAIERSGFKLVVKEEPVTGCGGTFKVPTDGSVVVATTHYPNLAYRVNENCDWRFQADPGRELTVQFLDFKTERYSDVVSAGFGDEPAYDWSNYVIKEHSGDGLPDPPAFNTKSDSAWISFSSDSFIVERGFKVIVGDSSVIVNGTEVTSGEEHEMNQDCGGEISREEPVNEVIIRSPRDNGAYPHMLDCTWVVNIPFGGHVKVQWDQFLTEANRDVVTLGNGSDPFMESTVIDKYSGLRAPDQIDGYFQSLWIRFQTDLKNSLRGWQLRILPVPYTECGGLLEVPEGGSLSMASPGYPDYYHNSQTCRYTIQSTSGSRILFTITEFDTSYHDYISVGEGCSPSDSDSIILDKQSIVKPVNYQFLPRTAEVWMKFSSDEFRNRPGWVINIADSGVRAEGDRSSGPCEQYSSDPTTEPPLVPTQPEKEEVVVMDEKPDTAIVADVDDTAIDVPDWYDYLSEEDEEEVEPAEPEEKEATKGPVWIPTVAPTAPPKVTHILEEEGSGFIQ